jgi:hypothetical protein
MEIPLFGGMKFVKLGSRMGPVYLDRGKTRELLKLKGPPKWTPRVPILASKCQRLLLQEWRTRLALDWFWQGASNMAQLAWLCGRWLVRLDEASRKAIPPPVAETHVTFQRLSNVVALP